MKFQRLFKPITINNLKLKNRVVMPAIHLGYSEDGYINEKIKSFYFERAEGGVGLITLGGCKFDSFGGTLGMPNIGQDKYMESFKELTEGVHNRGAHIAIQLYHAGGYNKRAFLEGDLEPIAPSAIFSPYSRETPKEITKDEIGHLIKQYAEAAKRSKEVGFDAVEISGSAGYLISQFLSPLRNNRNDEYGGSWDNRTRFVKELVRETRQVVGDNYPLIMRISGNDFVDGSNNLDDAVAFSKLLEELGIDAINVTGGWHETVIPQISGDVDRGGFVYLSKEIKKAVSIPVMASNRINDPYVAEKILALDNADLINIGRAMLADPQWCNKAMSSREDEIKYCVACNQKCLSRVFFGKPAECLVNPITGYEYKDKRTTQGDPRKILVIGAGPAGCEFAVRAAERGHHVEIWEKSGSIGGQVRLASKIYGKKEFETLIQFYERMFQKNNITLKLFTEANSENISNTSFDEIVVATGSSPRKFEIEKFGGHIKVLLPEDILLGNEIAGKNTVVIGGGSIGCEIAHHLSVDSTLSQEQLYFLMANRAEKTEKIFNLLDNPDRNVSIIEMGDGIGKGFEPGTAWYLFKELKRLKVKQHVNSKVIAVTDKIVKIQNLVTNEVIEIECDTIINATGYEPNNLLYEKLNKTFKNVHIIGDSVKVGKISDAIRQGNELSSNI